MPISRKRSCIKCRETKARCSQTVPQCARCVERGLPCEYVGLSLRGASSPYARPVDLSNVMGPDSTASMDVHVALPSAAGNDPSASRSVSTSDRGPEQAVVIDLDQSLLSSAEAPSSVTSFLLDAFDSITPGFSCIDLPLLPELRSPPLRALVASPVHHTPPYTPIRHLLSGPQPSVRCTLRKRVSVVAGSTSGNIMLGQVESYPRMLTEGLSLPPFIHSQCFPDDQPAFDCHGKRVHVCLPETLGVCASLVRLFYARTEASSAFVWRAIYAEQARLGREFHDYDHPALLEALQALCIYTILQTQDPDSLEKNDTMSLIHSLSGVGTRLYNEYEPSLRNYPPATPMSRREWLFRESTVRTFCLLLLVESLLELIIGRVEEHCSGYYDMPLPCGRELWEVESTAEWTRRYGESLRRRKSSRPLNVRTFMSTQRRDGAGPDVDPEREAVLADVASWCQGVDQYGILLWMVMNMKRE